MKKSLFILLFTLPLFLFSQKLKKEDIGNEDFFIIKNDSLTIPLDEIIVLNKRKFDSSKERKYYFWYTKKVRKAYPYAKLSADKMTELNLALDSIKSKRKRRKHVKKVQKYLEGEFTEQLKKMTRTEGRILIKLINRQTGKTMYNLIKNYRSGLKAFMYNTSAKFFKLNLKNKYQPEEIALDFLVEDILQRSFIDGALISQEAHTPIDYFELQQHWNNLSVVDVINEYIEKYK